MFSLVFRHASKLYTHDGTGGCAVFGRFLHFQKQTVNYGVICIYVSLITEFLRALYFIIHCSLRSRSVLPSVVPPCVYVQPLAVLPPFCNPLWSS